MSKSKVYVRKALAASMRAALPTNKDNFVKIGNPLRSNGQGNILGPADEILDLAQGKFQDEINAELRGLIEGATGDLSAYQKKLVAGSGIAIDESTNTIRVTVDHTLFRLVSTLPEAKSAAPSKIYLVADASGDAADQNVYAEYIVVSPDGTAEKRKWEKLGQYKSNIDLSAYLKAADAADTYCKKVDVLVAASPNPGTTADKQRMLVSYERYELGLSLKANATDVYKKTDTYNKTEVDAKIKQSVSTIWSLQSPVADKAALYAVTTAKKGYVYNVDAAVTVGGETYPAKTNFVVIADFTGATTDDTFAERFDSLGGVFNMDAVNNDINKLYNIVFANHASASISVNKTLIEKGVDTAVTVSWNFGVAGATGDDAKPSAVRVTKSGAVWVTDGVTVKSKADTIKDSTHYEVGVAFPHGATKVAQVAVVARYPIYIVCSDKTALTSADIVAADGDNHKKYVWNNLGNGATVSVNNSTDNQYVYVCVPSDMNMTDAKMGGQPFGFEAAAGVTVDGKGTYRAYRSKWAQNAGALSFQVWGGNTSETPPTPPTQVYVFTGPESVTIPSGQNSGVLGQSPTAFLAITSTLDGDPTPWKVTSKPSWVTEVDTSGTGSITASANVNSSGALTSNRSGEVVLTQDGSLKKLTIKVTQEGSKA